jgi:hypothetical protein
MGANKEDLAQWVSLALEKALTTTNISKGFLAIGIWPLNLDAMASKKSPFEAFVDSEPKTQTMDLQVKEVINENTNTLEGDVCHCYVDIDGQCEIDDIEMDNDKVRSNWVFD